MVATAAAAPPQFAATLAEASAEAAAVGVHPDWTRRLRHLLLAGRPLDELERVARRRLAASLALRAPLTTRLLDARRSPDGATKLLVGLADGGAVETVVLPSSRGVSVCLSSQVGCPIGCRFCASGAAGLARNLAAHEIVEQLVHARRVDPRVDRLVVMGIGEPLLNPEALFRALDRIRAEGGIGARRMIVSTVGPAGGIRRVQEWGVPVTLAVSLHAPDDALRAELIPNLRGARIERLLAELDGYIAATGRKALAAYTLLRGVNDAPRHARAVGALLRGRQVYLNAIPYNPVPGAPYRPVGADRARRFVDVVRASGAFATVRKTLGGAETAACGQLRAAWDRPEIGREADPGL